jgi:hypothetical protein
MKPTQNRNGASRLVKLKLDSIRLDAGTQTRSRLDEMVVSDYAEAMIRGDRFPPVIVFKSNGEFIMADGFHRAKAARKARLTHILAELRKGTRRDALRFALGANHKHGLRRSNLDKRRAVEIALTEFENLSDHLLSEMCGVSQSFVTNVRQQLISEISSTPRLGKDGKLRTLPVRSANVSARLDVVGTHASDVQDAADQRVNAATLKIAKSLAGIETAIRRLAVYPSKRAAIHGFIAKAKSDLTALEKVIASGK